MGVDLTLCLDQFALPIHQQDWFLASNRLNTMRDYTLQEAISTLNPVPIPPTVRFDWYGDDGIERRTIGAYGAPLTYLEARAFAMIPPAARQMLSAWNLGILAMVATMPPETIVVLWWH